MAQSLDKITIKGFKSIIVLNLPPPQTKLLSLLMRRGTMKAALPAGGKWEAGKLRRNC